MTYNLKITEKQAEVLQEALEIYARLGIGQFRDALEKLPLIKRRIGWHDDLYVIGAILQKHMINGVDGWRTSLGISADQTSEEPKIAWDIMQVVRKKLSWQSAIAAGYVKSENSPRNWNKMMGVNYDDPMKMSDQSLAEIKEEKP